MISKNYRQIKNLEVNNLFVDMMYNRMLLRCLIYVNDPTLLLLYDWTQETKLHFFFLNIETKLLCLTLRRGQKIKDDTIT